MIISQMQTKEKKDKIQTLFMRKTFSKLGIERNFLKFIETICKNLKANTLLDSEKLKVFPVRSSRGKDDLSFTTPLRQHNASPY